MPIFHEMDPELIAKLTEGYENELEPETKKLDAFYRQFSCPRCKGRCKKHYLSSEHAFGDPDSLVARSGLKCILCDCVFDPHTMIILELGNVGKMTERILPTLTPFVGTREGHE